MKERDVYFDNLKFILISLVVMGHLFQPFNGGITIGPIFKFLYSFHMPLFIFIAGYFSKNIDNNNYNKKVIINFVIPYLIFETIYTIFDYFIFEQDKLEFTYFYPYWIMWFMFSMIIWKMVTPYLIKIKYIFLICVAVSLLAGYAKDVEYYASISRILYFFPFFLLGFYSKREWIKKLNQPRIKIGAVILLLVCFFLLLMVNDSIHVKWFFGTLPYQSIGYEDWYSGVYRLIGYVFSVVVGICILSLTPTKKLPIISNLGKNTLYVFILHGFIIKYLEHIEYYRYFTSTIDKLILMGIGLMITIFLSTNLVRYCTRWIIEPNLSFVFTEGNNNSVEEKPNKTFTTL